jgi:NDP-sugar pyrophosphorylase family protein
MSPRPDYRVNFGRIARTLLYEDSEGTISFTFELSEQGSKTHFLLEGRVDKGDSREQQARRNLAFERASQYLISGGHKVEDASLRDMLKVKKAVILAAGKGTRMGDLTARLPKPMVEVDGKPVLEHIIEGLRDEAGIDDFFIITGWCGDVIRDYFGDGGRWKVEIAYGEQAVQDGTGKAPELAKEWVGNSRFLLTYGDILLRPPADYKRLVDAYLESGVIAVKEGEDLTKGGAVVLDEDGYMIDLVEKSASAEVPANAFYNAGIYLLPALIFKYTAKLEKSPRGEYEFTDALKLFVEQTGAHLRGVTLRSDWADVRDPSVLAELNRGAKLKEAG